MERSKYAANTEGDDFRGALPILHPAWVQSRRYVRRFLPQEPLRQSCLEGSQVDILTHSVSQCSLFTPCQHLWHCLTHCLTGQTRKVLGATTQNEIKSIASIMRLPLALEYAVGNPVR